MWVIVVVAVLAGLAGLIILTLCVPIDAIISFNTSEKPRLKLKVRWFFGLISKELRREKKKPKEKKKVTEGKRKKKRKFEFRTVLNILRTEGLLRQFKNLVKGVFGQLKVKELEANLELGLEDPAETGLVFAFIGPAVSSLNLPSRYQVRVEPFFSGETVFEGYLHGVLRLQPVRLVSPVLRFVFSLPTLRVVKIFVVGKWKRKK